MPAVAASFDRQRIRSLWVAVGDDTQGKILSTMPKPNFMFRFYATLALISLALCFSIGCGSGYSFRPTSSFHIVDTALHDMDTINIVYCSGGPQENDGSFYYHLIAERTTDSKKVNVLVDDISSLQEENSRKVFISSTSTGYRYAMDEKQHPSPDGTTNLKDAPPVKRREKAVIGKHHDEEVFPNSFPTVIGSLGETSIPKEVQSQLNSLLPDSQKLH